MSKYSLLPSVVLSAGVLIGCSSNFWHEENNFLLEKKQAIRIYGISFEERKASEKEITLTFDQSLERLRAKEYDRHLSSKEVCNLVVDGLEGRLMESSWQNVFKCMSQRVEWVSMAFERLGLKLRVYKDPERFVWTGSSYVIQGYLWCSDQKDFFVEGNNIPLVKCSDEFLKFVYGRTFHELPEKARSDAVIVLPENKKIMPVRRFGLLSLDGTGTHAYSRGVQVKEMYRDYGRAH